MSSATALRPQFTAIEFPPTHPPSTESGASALELNLSFPEGTAPSEIVEIAEALQRFARQIAPHVRTNSSVKLPSSDATPVKSQSGTAQSTARQEKSTRESGSRPAAPIGSAQQRRAPGLRARRGQVSPLAPARQDHLQRVAQYGTTAPSPRSGGSPASAWRTVPQQGAAADVANRSAGSPRSEASAGSANPAQIFTPAAAVTTPYNGTGLLINTDSRHVSIDGEAIEFTYKEFELLAYLAANSRRVVGREEIMTQIWDHADADTGERTIDVHVRRVRSKLKGFRNVITTVRGAGYRFDPSSDVHLALAFNR